MFSLYRTPSKCAQYLGIELSRVEYYASRGPGFECSRWSGNGKEEFVTFGLICSGTGSVVIGDPVFIVLLGVGTFRSRS